MTNRKLVLGLIGAYAGFVFGVVTIGFPVNLLGSTLNFFTDPSATERLAEFDDDGDAIPDFVNGPRILEIFRSAPDVLSTIFGRPAFVPGMIRLDDAFYMPEPALPTDGHGAAPVVTEAETETEVNFTVVEPQWSPEDIRVSNEFEGGTLTPGMHLVPSASPSSSLPATLLTPPPASTSSVSSSVSTSSATSVTAPPSSTPPLSSTPPADVPPTATASSVSTSSLSFPSSAAATSSSTSFNAFSSSDTAADSTSSMMGMDCDFDGDADDICSLVCQMYWTDKDGDGDKDPPTPPCS
ncbi:hypothetical protein A3C37_01400 [Candidatus Peribacteria bacterium RIFCSPHIGHO2_02_FULL_53_20]|nr:MAG: hypothetical protein A3C37_01400 [Candidatus Peribacteria bacterium RIFCSPHIGHO2_02_FULL_53_20]OGJ74996.1 MAG: hypothetical protein A3G69_00715 [Candidatus Peribacteria bacterium RIFCSPLOWO2_12_FULL_53_10]